MKLSDLSQQLGVSEASLQLLRVTRVGEVWQYPERNADGEIIGQAKRFDGGRKGFVEGGHRGVVMPWPPQSFAGISEVDPVLVVEGMTDTAAGLDLGFDIVGRHSNTGGADYLAVLLKDRHVCIVGENDGKGADDPKRPGKIGAEKIAQELAKVCASVKIVYPPAGCKDLRTWLTAPAPVTRDELQALIRNTPRWGESSDGPTFGPIVRCFADIEPKVIDWLWNGRIPLGRITLLSGKPGEGKSFITCDMASRISRGANWPDGAPCDLGSVLLVTCEDNACDTIRPRLDAHRADVRKIHHLAGVQRLTEEGKPVELMFTLADIASLEDAIKPIEDLKLIVIDPIGSFLGGSVDSSKDNAVRSVLAPIAAIAEKYGPAVVMVAHTRKSDAGGADDRVMGSRAFTGIARSVWHVSRDAKDAKRRLMLSGKNNLAPEGSGLAFRIEGEGNKGAVCWEPDPVGMSADEAIDEAREFQRDTPGPEAESRADAVAFLRMALAGGPRLATELVKDARDGHSISKRTLDRAKKSLRVESFQPKIHGPWYWTLDARLPSPSPSPQHSTTWQCGNVAETIALEGGTQGQIAKLESAGNVAAGTERVAFEVRP